MERKNKYIIQSSAGIGDIIQILSMARSIKEKEPDSRVDLLMGGDKKRFEINNQIINLQSYIDNIYRYHSKEFFVNVKTLLSLMMNQYHYGFVFVGAGSDSIGKSLWPYYIMKLAWCKKIIASNYDKADINADIPPNIHYLKRNAIMLSKIQVKGRNNAESIDMNKIEDNSIKRFKLSNCKQRVVISLGTNPVIWRDKHKHFTYDVKSWSYSNWINLANKLADRNIEVVLLGGIKEKRGLESESVYSDMNKSIVNMAGQTSIMQSFAVLKKSDLVVGAEGGMMHCASAIGKRTLTLFAGSDERRWNPGGENGDTINLHLPCSPCLHTERGAYCHNHKCLNGILPDMVYTKILDILEYKK